MQIRIIFLLTSLISSSNIHTVIIDGMELIHPEKNTRIYLLGDWHESVFIQHKQIHQNLLSPQVMTSLEQECAEQSRILGSFALHLLPSKENNTYIITETPKITIEDFVEYGLQNMPQLSVLECLPAVFLQLITQGATTKEERLHFVNQTIFTRYPTERAFGTVFIPIHESLCWIIGDRARTGKLGQFCINTEEFRSLWKQNKPLPEEFVELNLGILKKYILHWQSIFKINQFDDTCGDRLLAIINTALTNGCSESDHLILLLEQLDQGQLTPKDVEIADVITLIRRFESHIFDCELEHYIKCIDTPHEKNTLIVLAGASHTQRLSKSLQQQDYFSKKIPCGIKKSIGITTTIERLCDKEERKKFNNNLEQLLNRIVHQNQQAQQARALRSYLPYAPAVVTGSVGLLSLMSDNSKAKIVAGAAIVATPLMALAARYYQQ